MHGFEAPLTDNQMEVGSNWYFVPCWNYFKCCLYLEAKLLSGLRNKLLMCWFFSERPTPPVRLLGGRPGPGFRERLSAVWVLSTLPVTLLDSSEKNLLPNKETQRKKQRPTTVPALLNLVSHQPQFNFT